MKLTITIDCNGVAFDDCGAELAGVLRQVCTPEMARNVSARKTVEVMLDGRTLFDSNGSIVGLVEVTA